MHRSLFASYMQIIDWNVNIIIMNSREKHMLYLAYGNKDDTKETKSLPKFKGIFRSKNIKWRRRCTIIAIALLQILCVFYVIPFIVDVFFFCYKQMPKINWNCMAFKTSKNFKAVTTISWKVEGAATSSLIPMILYLIVVWIN